jgi:signal transduction histidine kinase
MDLRLRSTAIYGFLVVIWLLVVGWQAEEHSRVRDAAKTELREHAAVYATLLSATIRGQQWRNAVIRERLQPVMNRLVSGETNEPAQSGELISVMLLNTNGDAVISVGPTNYLQPAVMHDGEYWGPDAVTFVKPVYGVERTNSVIVLPSPRDFTNDMREFRGGPLSADGQTNGFDNRPPEGQTDFAGGPRDEHRDGMGGPPPPGRDPGDGRPDGRRNRGRPPWMGWLNEDEMRDMMAKYQVHGLVMTISTDKLRASMIHDIWLRFVISFFGGIAVAGFGLAWRTVGRSSDLQIRLVRASEMNTHLREMNLAAAGLAHETRNPLNIIRGMAQMLSRQPDATPDIKEKSSAIVNETDKVTAQLNEFINYSRPREIRRVPLALPAATQEVVRALNFDMEEKKIKLEVKGDPVTIEADQQLFRQMLFNLLLNAVQAQQPGGEILVVTGRRGPEAFLEVRDNGPGVPPENRKEIFKPYFTTHQKGTGLGLAVVQQIVLAHGWEIECLGNEPRGAVFRITHLKVSA